MNWSPFDYALAGVLLVMLGVGIVLALRLSRSPFYRAGFVLAHLTGIFLFVACGAVGLIGTEDHDANMLYLGVLGICLAGALLARFRPAGMAWTFTAAAGAQALIGAVALALGWGSDAPNWPWDVAGATGMFVLLWLASAWLFLRSAGTPAQLAAKH